MLPSIKAALNLKAGHPVKDAEMAIAPSHVRTRRLVRKTAVLAVEPPNEVIADTMSSLLLFKGRFILERPDKCESARLN